MSVVGLDVEARSRHELFKEHPMPRGDKSSYTGKQKKIASHIEKGYEKRGTGRKEAEHRAWATVNKATGGGMRGSSPSRGGGKARTSAARSGKSPSRAAAR